MLAIITSIILYKCFENYGFKYAIIFQAILTFIRLFIQNNGEYIVLSIITSIIISLIATPIDYWIYKKTSSFISYFIATMIVGLLIGFGLGILVIGALA